MNPPTWGGKVPDYVRNRRTIYQPFNVNGLWGRWKSFPYSISTSMTLQQSTTTVATQALFLLNSGKEQASC